MEENVQDIKTVTTRSVGFKYGIIATVIGIFLFVGPSIVGSNPFSTMWTWINVAISVVILFMAHKEFKDNGDGFMSYGQGIAIGFWFTILSTVLSVIVMYVYVNFIDAGVMDLFYDEQRVKMEEQGQSEETIEIGMEWTRKLFWVFAFVAPVFGGMIIALILTIFTQKKAPEQAF